MAAEREVLLADAAATERLGELLGEALPRGTLIALDGELGAGKTTLVRGLARALGIEGAVTSPTFILHQRYQGRRCLDHLDAWMEGRERGLLADGGFELFGESDLVVVEWAERVEELLPRPHLAVRLEPAPGGERRARLSVRGEGEGAAALRRVLEGFCAPPEQGSPAPPEADGAGRSPEP